MKRKTCTEVPGVTREGGPNVVDLIRASEVDLIINTAYGSVASHVGAHIRTAALRYGVPLVTTLSAAQAAVTGIAALRKGAIEVESLQSLHPPRT